jgi:hypothetical protein
MRQFGCQSHSFRFKTVAPKQKQINRHGILIAIGGQNMPELSRFYNIVIKMLFSDIGQHNKPHIHAIYNEYDASIGIDGELLAGCLPVRQLRLVLAWLAIHEEELYAAWNNAVRNEPFDKIEPLR